jgi:nitrite reductase/ring-hydroxylating ferredoxin subunit
MKFLVYISPLIVLSALSISSCRNTNQTGVPYVPVNIQLIVSNPDFVALQAVGGHVTITGGSQGIMIYRASPEEFRAYDRHCTFLPEEFCRVTIDNTDIFAVCDACCNTKFLLVDGSPVEGPAPIGLLQYNTSFNGNALWITN